MTEHPKDLLANSSPSEAKIYCDGASSGNPGHAGIGVVIQHKSVHPGLAPCPADDRRAQSGAGSSPRPRSLPDGWQAGAKRGGQFTVHRVSEYIGIATNNIAEYAAFIKGIELARTFGLKKIEVFLDSELLVRQILGVYRVKNPNLRLRWVEAKNILEKFDYYRVTHVRRELNKEADLLAKKAIRDFLVTIQ